MFNWQPQSNVSSYCMIGWCNPFWKWSSLKSPPLEYSHYQRVADDEKGKHDLVAWIHLSHWKEAQQRTFNVCWNDWNVVKIFAPWSFAHSLKRRPDGTHFPKIIRALAVSEVNRGKWERGREHERCLWRRVNEWRTSSNMAGSRCQVEMFQTPRSKSKRQFPAFVLENVHL